jgi:hypothetical protein
MSDDADTLIKHQAALETKKANFMTWWQDICYRVLPAEATFTTISSEGEKRTERLFDSTAAKANRAYGSILEDLATPRSSRWHGIGAENEELSEDQETDEYFDAATNVLFSMREKPKSMFYAARAKNYLMQGAVGNRALFIPEVVGDGSRYIPCHMREITWAEDQYGAIDTIYRKYPIMGKNAIAQFGDQLSSDLRTKMQEKPFDTWQFLHCVKPNEERIPSRRDHRGMEWSGFYVSLDDKSIVDAGGFWEWPWAIARDDVAVGESYGRSPAMMCWPSIMTLQEQKKTILRAGQKEVDPPILLSEEGPLGPFSLKSAAMNYGAVSADGHPLAVPFKTGANIPLGLELMSIEGQDVRDAFLSSLWDMIVNENIETAAQVYELARKRAINLAPLMGRTHSEDLGPMIHRELGIASRNGLLPPLPRRLARMGGGYKPVYTSPLAKAMRAQDGLAIVRTLEVLPAAIAVDPRARHAVKITESMRELADINGMPAKLVRSLEEIGAIDAQEREQAAAAAAASVAPEMSQAALNAAKAQQIRLGGAA